MGYEICQRNKTITLQINLKQTLMINELLHL